MTRMEATQLLNLAGDGGIRWWEEGRCNRERLSDEVRLNAALQVEAESDALGFTTRDMVSLQRTIEILSEKIAASQIGYSVRGLRGTPLFEQARYQVLAEARRVVRA